MMVAVKKNARRPLWFAHRTPPRSPSPLSISLSRSGGVPWDGPGEKAHKVFYNDLSADPLSRTVSSVRPQDGAKEMERNEATAKHVAWPSFAWQLLSFFPFPVGHPPHPPCRIVHSMTWDAPLQNNVRVRCSLFRAVIFTLFPRETPVLKPEPECLSKSVSQS